MLLDRLTKRSLKKINILLCGVILALASPDLTYANSSFLQSGPMVGYSEMKEVLLWVQTNRPAKVKFEYWEAGNPGKRYFTAEVQTSAEMANVAKLTAEQVEEGKKYNYELFIDSVKVARPYPLEFQTQKLWQYRTDPPSFKVAMGSCTYVNEPGVDRPGKPYGGDYGIFQEIYKKDPDVMLWLGDNTYLREVDWNSKTGIMHRYTHTRALPEIQPLLGSVHNYAIWDDHDYGPNDSDRSFREKETTLEAFELFWGNPGYGTSETPGAFTRFEWADAEFFMLDNRYYRTPNNRKTGDKTILGEEQLQWFIDSLASSRAPFKFVLVGGQFINPVDKFENYAVFTEERQRILDAIQAEGIEGVIFITGDRHATELSMLNRPGSYPLYDFTVSPLTASPYNAASENNFNRVDGTYVAERNFAVMEISGPRKDRKLVFSVFDKTGKKLWDREIKASALTNPKK